MFKIKKIKVVFVACILSLVAIPAFATEIFFNAKTQEIRVSQLFGASIFINTEQEEINAIEGKISFPGDLLEFKEIRDGNSIVNFWIEKPRLSSASIIIFSGITPGGFKSENGLLFSLVFQAKEKGSGEIEFLRATALKNDGLGTAAAVSAPAFNFEIKEGISALEESVQVKIRDYEQPETFRPEIAKDDLIFNGRWFLVFATQDKGSGIDHYEVKEQKRMRIWKREFGIGQKWETAESPYILKDQNLRSYIFVKAVDKSGNARIEVLSPAKPLALLENYFVYVIFVIVMGLIILMYFIWRRKRGRKSTYI